MPQELQQYSQLITKIGARTARFILALTLVLPAALSQAQTNDDAKTLKSASELDYPPLSLSTPEGEAGGFSVDLLKAVSHEMGYEIEFYVAPWSVIRGELERGNLDVLPAVAHDPGRLDKMELSVPYLTVHGGAFVRKGTQPIQSMDDLIGRQVIVMKGDIAYDYLQGQQLDIQYVVTEDPLTAMRMLEAGEGDCLILQQLVGLQILETNQFDKIDPEPTLLKEFKQHWCFGVTKGDTALLNALNEGLAIIKSNGTYDRIHHKWFSPTMSETELLWTDYKPIVYTLLVLLLIILLLFVSHSFLRHQIHKKTRELKAANEQLQRTQNRMKALAEQQPGVLYEYVRKPDGSTRTTYISAAVEVLLGVTPEQVYINDDCLWMHVNSSDRERLKEPVQGDHWVERFKVQLPGKPDKWLRGESRFSGQYDENDNPLWYGYFRDITSTVHREEDLLEAKNEAERASQVKSRFLAVMSHELRTPLTPIMALCDLLLAESKDPNQKDALDTIKESAHTLNRLLKDILDFARLEFENTTLEPGAYKLKPYLDELFNAYERQAAAKQLGFIVSYKPNLPNRILIDGSRLRSALERLLSNAIKFTDKGRIDVKVATRERTSAIERIDGARSYTLKISVINTGATIPEKELSHIYEPFRQVDDSATRRHGGTGLGLALCYKLVTLMGGELEAKNLEGENKGCEFTITLPVTEAPQIVISETSSDAHQSQNTPRAKMQVLIAEDDRVIQKTLSLMLRKKGIRHDIASDGLEAVAMCKEKFYNIILMDVHMPRLDGIQATRAIRAIPDKHSQARVYALTADIMGDTRDRCLEAGMDGFLAKPIVPAQLEDLIQ